MFTDIFEGLRACQLCCDGLAALQDQNKLAGQVADSALVSNRKTMCMCEIGMAAALGSHPYCELCWEHPKNPNSATSQWACSKKLGETSKYLV